MTTPAGIRMSACSPEGARSDAPRFTVEYGRGDSVDEAVARQRAALERLAEDRSGPGLLLCVEHEPVVTVGRAAREEHVLADAETLAARGVALRRSKRGGDVTVHGPGQVTLYPVFPMEWFGRDLHLHLRRLEEIGIRYLAGHGVSAHRERAEAPRTGVWVGDEKIGACGVAVSRWIVWQGAAMNVQPDMTLFDLVVPCGIADKGVTSLARLTGKSYDMDAEMRRMVAAFAEVFEGAVLDGA